MICLSYATVLLAYFVFSRKPQTLTMQHEICLSWPAKSTYTARSWHTGTS